MKVLKVSDGVTQPGRRAVSLWAEVYSQQCFGQAVALVFTCPQQGHICKASSVGESQLLASSSARPGVSLGYNKIFTSQSLLFKPLALVETRCSFQQEFD